MGDHQEWEEIASCSPAAAVGTPLHLLKVPEPRPNLPPPVHCSKQRDQMIPPTPQFPGLLISRLRTAQGRRAEMANVLTLSPVSITLRGSDQGNCLDAHANNARRDVERAAANRSKGTAVGTGSSEQSPPHSMQNISKDLTSPVFMLYLPGGGWLGTVSARDSSKARCRASSSLWKERGNHSACERGLTASAHASFIALCKSKSMGLGRRGLYYI